MTKYILPLFVLAPAFAHGHFIWATYDASTRNYCVEFAESPSDDRLEFSDDILSRTIVSGKGQLARVQKDFLTMSARKREIPFEATMEYGVVERGEKPYMLRYQFRAFDRIASAAKINTNFLSVAATPEPTSWRVTTFWNGKESKTPDLFLADGTMLERGNDGAFHVALGDTPGPLPLRASQVAEGAGNFKGKVFAFTKVWSTVVLPPLDKIPEASDVNAYRLLELAGENRESLIHPAPWQTQFVAENLKSAVSVKGLAVSSTGTDAKFSFEDPDHRAVKHVTDQLESLFMHRGSRPFWKGDGRYAVKFSGSVNQLGQEVTIADSMDSSYRVKDGIVREVARTLGGKRLVIEIAEVQKLPCGRYLSKRFVVRSYDPATKKLEQELTYVDKFVQFGEEWMPKERTMTGVSSGESLAMKLSFKSYGSVTN